MQFITDLNIVFETTEFLQIVLALQSPELNGEMVERVDIAHFFHY